MVGLGKIWFSEMVICPARIYWEPMEKIKKWCALPYPDHPNGCPNLPDCKYFKEGRAEKIIHSTKLRIVWAQFDIEAYAAKMKKVKPTWTDRQCRNLLYWQQTLRKKLENYIHEEFGRRARIYWGAEGAGVNFVKTMKDIGVELDKFNDLKTVRMIALVSTNELW